MKMVFKAHSLLKQAAYFGSPNVAGEKTMAESRMKRITRMTRTR